MRAFGVALVGLISLTACTQVTNSGAGTNSKNEPISGSLTYNEMGTGGTFVLRGLAGYECTGTAVFDRTDTSTFPLTCTDGRSGTAMSTINRFASQQTISYRLSNGETGSVALGQI
ncbi:hypothetical protein GCM10010961_44820 [Pseudodonghicola xiamenensis]|uniref:Uncharacterized protein n=1 Tax=Pseudodonghicola xiamenensis TaxID=337702 RepID=A0A8J3HBU1_9RHOB|nr:hypothetical protein GCM10010961_44820 [Pseudodonghicola xiamenensis]